jgi:hypothetical protein
VLCTRDVSKRKRARRAKDGGNIKVAERIEAD